MLMYTFTQIDFADSLTEFLEIYSPKYPDDFVKQCTGSNDANCGFFVDCLSAYPLGLSSTDSLSVTLLKSAEINRFCAFSMNANVTVQCGGPQTVAPTPAPTPGANTNISRSVDLTGYSLDDAVSFTIPVQSTIDNGRDSLFRIEFDFENGRCNNPSLRFDFEEIDFAESAVEFISLYSPSYPRGYITQCTGSNDAQCGSVLNCIDSYVLSQNATDSVTVYLLKSADINRFCAYSLNANVPISCGPAPPTSAPSPAPSPNPTPSPTSPQFAFESTFDLSGDDGTVNNYAINVHSAIDNGVDVIFNVTFKFEHGTCFNPLLSVEFEEIDQVKC